MARERNGSRCKWQRNAMIDDDLGPALVNVDLRPLRLADLIHAGSVGEFVAAVAEATSRWGGIREPIIPVRDDGTLDERWRRDSPPGRTRPEGG
jgi:hypothetical protein